MALSWEEGCHKTLMLIKLTRLLLGEAVDVAVVEVVVEVLPRRRTQSQQPHLSVAVAVVEALPRRWT